MKKEKILFLTTAALFCFCLLSQTAFGQTIIRRQDFDSNTTLTFPSTSSLNVSTGIRNGLITNDYPNAIPTTARYGAESAVLVTDVPGQQNASSARFATATANGTTGTVTITSAVIPQSAIPAGNDLFISFRGIGVGLAAGAGIDGTDSIALSVSLDGGASFSSETEIAGRSDAAYTYNIGNAETATYDGNNAIEAAKSFRPTTGGLNDPTSVSKVTLRIPNASITASGVIVRFILTVNRTDELLALDDIIVYALPPTAAPAKVSERIATFSGRGISKASVTATDASGQVFSALTNPFGYYNFNGLNAGETYVFEVRSKGYSFAPQVLFLGSNLTDVNFTPIEAENKFGRFFVAGQK